MFIELIYSGLADAVGGSVRFITSRATDPRATDAEREGATSGRYLH